MTRHPAPGTFKDIGVHDVLKNIADNLSRRTKKESETDLVRDSAIVRRGSANTTASVPAETE